MGPDPLFGKQRSGATLGARSSAVAHALFKKRLSHHHVYLASVNAIVILCGVATALLGVVAHSFP